MATSNNRDVKMTLSVETLGAQEIKKLETGVRELAKGAGDAAPEFEALADEIAKLGSQADVLRNFQTLSEETQQLAVRQEQAATATTELRTRLEALQSTTEAAATTQRQAQQAYDQANQELRATSSELQVLRSTYDENGKRAANYKSEVERLTRAKVQQKDAVDQNKAALDEANASLKNAETAQAKLQRSYEGSERALQSANTALTEQRSELDQQRQAVEAIGLSTDDLATSQARLVQALNATGQAAQQTKASLDQVKRAEEELTAQAAEAAARLADRVQATRSAYEQEQAAAEQAAQAARDRVAAEERASEAIIAARRAEQAESDRLVALQEAGRERLAAAARQQLLAEQEAQRDSLASVLRFEEQKKRAIQESAEAARRATVEAAQAMSNAFSSVGIRGINEVQTELAQVRDAMQLITAQSGLTGRALDVALQAGANKTRELERELRELNGTLTLVDRSANLFKNSLGQIAAGNLIADGVGYLVNKVKELGVAFVDTIRQTESFRRALNAIYKDTEVTNSQFDFLKRTAVDAGVAVGGIQQAFVKFSASTKSANIPLEQSNALFAALVKAGGTLGLSADAVSGSLEALSQMAAKGTVSMEELRQQLGDRLPGALSLVAQGLGITDGQLIKLVESGGLAARDLFPALTKALQTMQGEITGITPLWENFKNALTETAQNAGDSGWALLLAGAIRALTAAVGVVVLPLSALSEVIFGLAKSAGILAGALVTMTNPLDALKKVAEDAADRQTKLTDTFDRAVGFTDAATQATQRQVAALNAARSSQEGLTTVTVQTEAGQKALAAATALAGDTTLDASQKWVQLNTRISEALAPMQKSTEAAEKSAKAVKEQGDSLVALAALRGNELAALEAQVAASENYLDALERAAVAQKAETELLEIQRAAFVDSAQARGLTTAQIESELVALDAKIAKSRSESEQSTAAVASMQLEAVQRRIAVQTYDDNSAAIGRYEQAMIAAEATASVLRTQMQLGFATQQQVREADLAAAQARAVYNDALSDSVARIQQVSQVEQARINITQAGLGVQQQAYQQLAAAARLSGDYAAAVYYEIEAKRVQIQVTQLQAQAKRLEAQAQIEAINAERAALEATGNLTAAKKAELDARLANAKAKEVEAGASAIVIRALEQEIAAIRNLANSRDSDTSSRRSNASSIDTQTASLTRLNAARQQEQELVQASANDPYGRSPDQIKNLRQQGGPVDASYNFQVQDRLNRGDTFGADELEALRNGLRVSEQNAALGNPGSVSLEGRRDNDKWVNIFRRAVEQAEAASNPVVGANRPRPAPTPAPTPSTVAPLNNESGRTVTINLGGRSTTISTSSASEADKLINLIKQLETAAGTSA